MTEQANNSAEPLAAVILAGGKAARYGGAIKSFIVVDGQRIIDRQLAVLRKIADPIAISSNDPQAFAELGLPILADEHEDAGPLAGIAAALAWSPHQRLAVVACDMPHVSSDVLRFFFARATETNADIVAPRVDGRLHPLFAVYSRNCAEVINARLQRGLRRATALLTEVAASELSVVVVDEAEIRTIDAGLRTLTNVNSPADLG